MFLMRMIGYITALAGVVIAVLVIGYLIMLLFGMIGWDERFWASLLLAFMSIVLVVAGLCMDEYAVNEQKKLDKEARLERIKENNR